MKKIVILNSLPYITATLIEVFRHSDIIPVLSRTSICDTWIQGKFIPKDTGCGILFPVIHKDPELFPQPYEFIPERFLDENMNVVNEENVTAFGGGESGWKLFEKLARDDYENWCPGNRFWNSCLPILQSTAKYSPRVARISQVTHHTRY